MSGRAPFTEKEDSLLMKYIATYSPSLAGRCGNKLFQTLVENKDHKWGWSKCHPWQGWRHRYISKQKSFDTRIRKYQDKKGLPTESPTYGATRLSYLKMPSAKGSPSRKKRRHSDEETDNNEIDNGQRPSSSVAPARKRTRIVPDISTLEEPVDSLDDSQEDALATIRQPGKQAKDACNNDDSLDGEDPFRSLPPRTEHQGSSLPPPARTIPKPRPPPKVMSNGFSATFEGVERFIADGSRNQLAEISWPPIRHRTKTFSAVDQTTKFDFDDTPTVPRIRSSRPQAKAIPSSSRLQLMSSTLDWGSPARSAPGFGDRRSLAPSPNTQDEQLSSPPESMLTSDAKIKARSEHHGLRLVSRDDVRRHSLPTPRPPQIDLELAVPNRKKLESLPARSRSPRFIPAVARHSSLSRSLFASPAKPTTARTPDGPTVHDSHDEPLMLDIARQTLGKMAANHGFSLDVVRNVFARSRDLAKTDTVLLRMRRKAEEVGEAQFGNSEDDLRLWSEERQSRKSVARSPWRTGAPEEEFHARPFELNAHPLAETEYTPPHGTRAAALIRLARKGRLNEGVKREQRRVSAGKTDRSPRSGSHFAQAALPFHELASADANILTKMEREDLRLSMSTTADVARYMRSGIEPSID
ncbi:unnamed protein product [Mycena citricolor]|uniref:TERF2-interacting telomeric protein 1 Myb domain-containing protein n=1 Tax=Mycena citricolor TaxID=2018698 RepID=A0AAD2HI52_9AGAR|nr:unnamed protein product [Mycena citricolor]